MRNLLIEDDDVRARSIAKHLKAQSYAVDHARDGIKVGFPRSFLTRRSGEIRTTTPEPFGFRLDLNRHRAIREGCDITLTAKESALLDLLMMNPNRILTR